MEIGLINLYSIRNAGDAAIYGALVDMLDDCGFTACIADVQNGESLAEKLRVGTECAGYISVGGDIFNNARPALATRTFLKNVASVCRHQRRTIVFGQSIPRSCKGVSFALLSQILKGLPSVTVRDRESWQRLRNAGIEAQLSFDTAFHHKPRPEAKLFARIVLAEMNLQPERCVLLSLRRFDRLYPHDNDRFIANLASVCRQLESAGLQPALLVQSESEGDDWAVVRSVRAQRPSLPALDALNHPEAFTSYEYLQGLTAIAGLTVGVRYHASVLAMAAGRLPFNLYYSNKGEDLCERLKVPGCDLATFDPEQGIAPLLACVGGTFNDYNVRQRLHADFRLALDSMAISPAYGMQP